MKEKILALRGQGFTYNAIQKELGCSKSTISFHCGEGQKEKSRERNRTNIKTIKGKIDKKISRFINVRGKIRDFKRGDKNRKSKTTRSEIDYEAAFVKIFETNKCYLSGRPIDTHDTKNYNLDHVIPTAKGGTNEFDNMGVACRQANIAKADMTIDEFIVLCKDILTNFGYKFF